MNPNRKGGWLQTYSGKAMFPLDPIIEELDILDIAHALGNICRFNGHVQKFYSVAEHCCHVHDLIPERWQLGALMHDSSEAYLCDRPAPIKHSAGFAEQYIEAETQLMEVIADKFRFIWPLVPQIKEADIVLLHTEATQLLSPRPGWVDEAIVVSELVLPCWDPAEARNQFLQRFERSTSHRSSI